LTEALKFYSGEYEGSVDRRSVNNSEAIQNRGELARKVLEDIDRKRFVVVEL